MTTAPRILFLGSFPPRECGIATFTLDVIESFDRRFGGRSQVIAIQEPGAENRRYDDRVVAQLIALDHTSYLETAAFINADSCDALNLQHEYGLFGGEDGEWVVDLIRAVRKPVITTLHTVLPNPSEHHMDIARAICATSTRIVVMSETGKRLLAEHYGVDASKIDVIHHGVPDIPFQSTTPMKTEFGFGDRTVISTFGLVNRGKGLEYAIDAMAAIVPKHPEALYLILGQTHPVVRRQEGESYRESLHARIEALGLGDNVKLVDKYLPFDELIAYLRATDVYLTPYLNPTQIVSGTLAYAVGCGKAVISTPYLYAEELLAHGRGFLVPFRDGGAIASAISALLDDPALREAVERRAYRFGRRMTWPHVASDLGELFTRLVPAKRPVRLLTSA